MNTPPSPAQHGDIGPRRRRPCSIIYPSSDQTAAARATAASASKAGRICRGAGSEADAIRVPVLLQWGDRDPVVKTPVADKAVAQFENTKVTLIHYPDFGHCPMIELPERTGADLEAWLDRIVPR